MRILYNHFMTAVIKVEPKELVNGWMVTPTINMVTGQVVGEFASKPIERAIQAKFNANVAAEKARLERKNVLHNIATGLWNFLHPPL